jgi:(p)ppGpp synthase/HD superfamily hydrolase
MASLEDAIALAVEAHRGQLEYDGSPYVLHPLRVMVRLGLEAPEAARIVAVLHDVVEDTPVTLDDLRRRGFSEEVLTALDLVTRRDDETYEQFIERLLPNEIARAVKRADLQDNMEIVRLPAVTPKDVDRLARYRAAWARLAAHADPA